MHTRHGLHIHGQDNSMDEEHSLDRCLLLLRSVSFFLSFQLVLLPTRRLDFMHIDNVTIKQKQVCSKICTTSTPITAWLTARALRILWDTTTSATTRRIIERTTSPSFFFSRSGYLSSFPRIDEPGVAFRTSMNLPYPYYHTPHPSSLRRAIRTSIHLSQIHHGEVPVSPAVAMLLFLIFFLLSGFLFSRHCFVSHSSSSPQLVELICF